MFTYINIFRNQAETGEYIYNKEIDHEKISVFIYHPMCDFFFIM